MNLMVKSKVFHHLILSPMYGEKRLKTVVRQGIKKDNVSVFHSLGKPAQETDNIYTYIDN